MISSVLLDAGGVIVYPRMGDWFTPVRWDEFWGDKLSGISESRIMNAKREAARIFLDEGLPLKDEDMEFACRRNYFLEIARILDVKIDDSVASSLARDMTENDSRYGFYDDARAGVQAIGEVAHVGILSNAMPSLRRVLDNAGFLDMVDMCLLSCDIGAQKPDAKMYLTAAEMIGSKITRCAFVDDIPENLRGAEACGMIAIHMDRDDTNAWSGHRARNLFDVKRIIQEINS